MFACEEFQLTATAIVVTGLPAGGKTTVAKRLARELDWPLLDKDNFLEELFANNRGVKSLEDRRKLSNSSNVAFQTAATKLSEVVLVSHWRPKVGPQNTGTAPDFVEDHFDKIIEVHCICSPKTAVARFRSRNRHPGHMDELKSYEDIEKQIQSLANGYPLGIGRQLSIKTEGQVDYSELLAILRSEIGC